LSVTALVEKLASSAPQLLQLLAESGDCDWQREQVCIIMSPIDIDSTTKRIGNVNGV
jgi:hypothetical protein